MTELEIQVGNLLVLLYVGEVIWAVWAYRGILRYWREEGGSSSPIWTALVVMKGLAVLGALVTLPIAFLAIFGLPRIPFTGAIVTIVVMIQLAAVIVYRLTFDKIRRGSRPQELHEPQADASGHELETVKEGDPE